MADNRYLRWSFYVLVYGIGPVLILGLISAQARIERVGIMIVIGILSIAWMMIGNYGVIVAREMA